MLWSIYQTFRVHSYVNNKHINPKLMVYKYLVSEFTTINHQVFQ